MNIDPNLVAIFYIVSAILFIFGLKMLSSADTARKGNLISSLGMLLAIVVTLLDQQILTYQWIIVGLVAGAVIGAFFAITVEMTGMPEMVALFNGSGGAASLLVGWAEYHKLALSAGPASTENITFTLSAIGAAVLIGGLTTSGSLVAWGRLSGKMDTKPTLYPGQTPLNFIILVAAIGGVAFFTMNAWGELGFPVFIGLVVASLVLGVLLTIPIGGADMPVVIALLNSYSGLAACAAGFVIENTVLIVSGALVGASGLILTSIMCKAMNRSLANVLFGGLGATTQASSGEQGEAKVLTPDDAYYVLEAAANVIVVPGYGMAVAQAQHVVQELGEILEDNGAEVRYVIHPVAGRMPGHMNVLLAEANVPYEQLVEPDDVNPTMEMVDVAIVIGANDVVNPSARDDEGSSLYGMPIVEVDRARTVFVLKRSLRPGFAGVQNPLFFKENTRMILGDAKATVTQIVASFKED